MSILADFYDDSITQLRSSTTASDMPDTITTVSSFTALTRNITDKSKLFVESNYGKEVSVVCDDSESVNVGDDLVSGNFGTIDVIGVSKYTDLEDGSESHLDIRGVKK